MERGWREIGVLVLTNVVVIPVFNILLCKY